MGPASVVVKGNDKYLIFSNPATYATPDAIQAAGMTLASQAGAIHKITPGEETQALTLTCLSALN